MNSITNFYYFLGHRDTSMLLGLISGFVIGLTLVPGLMLPIILAIFTAVICATISGFINTKLPTTLQPVFGSIQLVSLLGHILFIIGLFKMSSMILQSVKLSEITPKK
jgi:hypothetical protein